MVVLKIVTFKKALKSLIENIYLKFVNKLSVSWQWQKEKPEKSVSMLFTCFNFQSLQHKEDRLIPKYLESAPAD